MLVACRASLFTSLDGSDTFIGSRCKTRVDRIRRPDRLLHGGGRTYAGIQITPGPRVENADKDRSTGVIDRDTPAWSATCSRILRGDAVARRLRWIFARTFLSASRWPSASSRSPARLRRSPTTAQAPDACFDCCNQGSGGALAPADNVFGQCACGTGGQCTAVGDANLCTPGGAPDAACSSCLQATCAPAETAACTSAACKVGLACAKQCN